jgi:quercetin dioxygenase-like cupin family protein
VARRLQRFGDHGAMRTFTKEEATGPAPELDLSHFTGKATGLPLHRSEQVNVTMVRFETGVRNHWHHHTGGQVLHVVDGKGYVQARGENVREIRPGDTITTAPGEEHWHGATEEGPMAHIAVSIGPTVWGGKS